MWGIVSHQMAVVAVVHTGQAVLIRKFSDGTWGYQWSREKFVSRGGPFRTVARCWETFSIGSPKVQSRLLLSHFCRVFSISTKRLVTWFRADFVSKNYLSSVKVIRLRELHLRGFQPTNPCSTDAGFCAAAGGLSCRNWCGVGHRVLWPVWRGPCLTCPVICDHVCFVSVLLPSVCLTTTTTRTVLRPFVQHMPIPSGLPGWAGTRRNTHPPTILIIIHSLSASAICHGP